MKFFTDFWERLREAYANRHEPERSRVIANAYWHVLLYVTAFIIFLSICYGLWKVISLFGVFSEEGPALVPVQRASTPRLEALDATVAGFEERQAQYDSRKDIVLPIADPSR